MTININSLLTIATGACIIFDITSGLIAAKYTNTLSSKVSRDGLYHKAGELLLLIFAFIFSAIFTALSDTPSAYILGFDTTIFSAMYPMAAVYIVLTETISILENIEKINPDLKSIINKLKSNVNNLGGDE